MPGRIIGVRIASTMWRILFARPMAHPRQAAAFTLIHAQPVDTPPNRLAQ